MLSVLDTLEPFQCMNELPSLDTFVCTLHKCREEKNSLDARRLHLQMCQCGLESHQTLGNHIIPMFVDCGYMLEAQQVFKKLVHHTEHSWTALIQGFNDCGEGERGFNLYDKMLEQGVNPSPFTFSVLLKECARLNCIKKGQELHAELTKKGFERSMSVGNTLVDMYARCGSLLDSQKSFDDLPLRDVFSWTTLAAGYADLGFAQEALTCFESMRQEGISPNTVSYLCNIKACGSLGDLDKGYLVHSEIAMNGFESMSFVGSALVGMYVKCGLLAQAQDVFDEMSGRDAVLWNILFMGYAEHGHDERVFKCWEQMKAEGVSPDGAAYVTILRTCSSVGAVERGQEVHAECLCKGFESDPYVTSMLIDMYMKCAYFLEAQQVFDESPTQDVVLWTGLIAGYAEHGLGEQALSCFKNMCCNEVLPNPITFACTLKACCSLGTEQEGQEIHIQAVKMGLESNLLFCGSLVDFYARVGLFAEAQVLFDRLPSQDVVSWNILIAGYVEHGFCEEGFECFQRMQQEGIPASVLTFVSSLKACGGMGSVEAGHEVHVSIAKQGTEADTLVGNILVDMYARCGSLAEAEDGFKRLASRDVISWTALIQGYADRDFGNEAIKYFELMQEEGISPDGVTFSCSLQACSSIGAIDRGQAMHIEMAKQGIERDILAGNGLVYMYTKLGLLAEAGAVFEKVLARDVSSWNMLIQGYAEQGLTEEALDCLRQMQLEGLSPDVFTWSAVMAGYVEHEITEKVFEIFAEMQEQGVAPNDLIFANLLASCGNMTALQNGKRFHSQILRASASESAKVNLATNLMDMYGKCGS
eukprot:c24234_g13_i3 orf=102-2546(+)